MVTKFSILLMQLPFLVFMVQNFDFSNSRFLSKPDVPNLRDVGGWIEGPWFSATAENIFN
jgi:hypothetical protein